MMINSGGLSTRAVKELRRRARRNRDQTPKRPSSSNGSNQWDQVRVQLLKWVRSW
jgi:hypothetical protein